MVRDNRVYLKHILDAIQKLERYVVDVEKEKFLSGEEMVRDAVARQL